MGNMTDAQQFLNIALEWASEEPDRMSSIRDSLDLAQTYRLLNRPDQALSLSKSFAKSYRQYPSSFETFTYLSGLGIDYTLLGHKDKAVEIAEFLSEPSELELGLYYAARIYAVLDEKEKAMDLLIQWRKGWGFSFNSVLMFKSDYFMQNLFGFPPFEEHVKIKDEALKD
jgi:hypothetical protein